MLSEDQRIVGLRALTGWPILLGLHGARVETLPTELGRKRTQSPDLGLGLVGYLRCRRGLSTAFERTGPAFWELGRG